MLLHRFVMFEATGIGYLDVLIKNISHVNVFLLWAPLAPHWFFSFFSCDGRDQEKKTELRSFAVTGSVAALQ